MKRYRLILLLIFVTFSMCDTQAQVNIKLAAQIDSLHAIDQNVQLEIKKALEAKVRFDSIQKLQASEKQTFDRHIPILKGIIAQHGYPTIAKVGEPASSNFFILIQHADSDLEFQSTMLPILQELAHKGEIDKKHYAYLYDRVQINAGKKQLYGTQLSFDSKGNLFDSTNKLIIPKNLIDPENVDNRRREMDLETLEQYYERVLTALGRPRKKR